MTTNTHQKFTESRLTIGPDGEPEEIVAGICWTLDDIARLLLDNKQVTVDNDKIREWVNENADDLETYIADAGDKFILDRSYALIAHAVRTTPYNLAGVGAFLHDHHITYTPPTAATTINLPNPPENIPENSEYLHYDPAIDLGTPEIQDYDD